MIAAHSEQQPCTVFFSLVFCLSLSSSYMEDEGRSSRDSASGRRGGKDEGEEGGRMWMKKEEEHEEGGKAG